MTRFLLSRKKMRCFRWQRHAPFSGAKSYAKTAHLFVIFLGVKNFPEFSEGVRKKAHLFVKNDMRKNGACTKRCAVFADKRCAVFAKTTCAVFATGVQKRCAKLALRKRRIKDAPYSGASEGSTCAILAFRKRRIFFPMFRDPP